MKSGNRVFEIPAAKIRDVDELIKWLEKAKLHEKKHPVIAFENDDLSEFAVLGIMMRIGTALMLLEEKGKIKSHDLTADATDYGRQLLKSKTSSKIEALIEKRYSVTVLLHAEDNSLVKEPEVKYGLEDVFGIWKNNKRDLNKIREEQWGRKK